jgi:tRNA (cytidine56-2'-O)-methyltransferase
VFLSDVHDSGILETINRVTAEFGGAFSIEAGRPWRHIVREWKRTGGRVVHLTAYGVPLPEVIQQIRNSGEDVLVVVGAEKVPSEMFYQADWNVAVTNQPISEVSALGIFLDWFFKHRGLKRTFANAKLRIIPSEHGKNVVGT